MYGWGDDRLRKKSLNNSSIWAMLGQDEPAAHTRDQRYLRTEPEFGEI